MSWLERLRSGRDRGPEIEEVKALSDQFYITLSAIALKVRGSEEQGRQAAGERIDALLDPDAQGWSWNRAYEVEQQLVQLFDDVSLRTEMDRRLLEAEPHLRKSLVDWYRERAKEATDDRHRRALLLRLVNDIQWRYTVKEAARNYTKQITERTGWLFIGSMLIFVASFLVVILVDVENMPQSASYLLLASASGLWGGAFSMLTGLKGRLAASSFDDLKLARSWPLMLSRVLLGAGAAVVLYLFIRSGLLAGAAFPSLEEVPAGDPSPTPNVTKLALFTLWCFIAGFSEKLVPGLLSKTEAKAADESEPATGRIPSTPQQTTEPPAPPEAGGATSEDAGRAESGSGGGGSNAAE